MNNFNLLLKINILQTFNINKVLHGHDRKEKRKLLFFLALMIFVGVVLVGYSYMCFSFTAPTLYKIGMLDMLIGLMMAVASFLIMFTSLYKVVGLIIGCKDYEMLAALPLKNSTIMISKWMTLYIGNLLSILLILIPGIYIYQSYISVDIGFYAMFILCVLVLPLLPIVVGCMIGVIIKIASSRFKYSNFIAMILVFGAMGTYMYFITSIESANQLTELATSIVTLLNQMYPLTGTFIDAVCNQDITSLVIFILINVFVFGIFTWVIAKGYMHLNTLLNGTRASSKYHLKQTKRTKILPTLIKKEIKRYFSSTIYVVNTAMGEVLQLLAVGYILIKGLGDFEQLFELGDISTMIAALIPLFICLTAGMGCTTHVSISIEGKQFWISKSLPITTMQVFLSKVAVYLMLALPISIFSTIVLSLVFKLTILQTVTNLITVIIFIICISMFGLIINLHFPQFDWESETKLVKQSMASFLQIALAMIITIVPMATIIITGNTNVLYIYLLIIGIVTIGLYQYLKTVGAKLYNTL